MMSPPGVKQWETINGKPAALKLLQALYGTKQASFLLNKRLNSLWDPLALPVVCQINAYSEKVKVKMKFLWDFGQMTSSY